MAGRQSVPFRRLGPQPHLDLRQQHLRLDLQVGHPLDPGHDLLDLLRLRPQPVHVRPEQPNHDAVARPRQHLLRPLFAIALAAIFLGERIAWQHWVGGVLIVAGAVIIATK